MTSFNIYVKWRRNERNFKTNVINALSVKKNSSVFHNDLKSTSGFSSLIIPSEDWKKLILTIGIGQRKKFTTYANEIFSNKIQSLGINCLYKIKHNSFSTSKNSSKNYWNGNFSCIKCENTVKAFIKKIPIENEDCILCLIGELNICSEKVSFKQFKRNIKGSEREGIQKDACLKGATNLRSEANFFDDVLEKKVSYQNMRKMRSQFRHRFQLENEFRVDSDAAKLVFDAIIPKIGNSHISGYIQEIQSNPIGALLVSDIQIKMWGIIKENNPVWYFDATGKLTPKYRDQSEVLLFSIVSHDKIQNSLIPIGDFLTSANDGLSIYTYLNKIIEKFKSYPFFEYPQVLVTDFSWANINACMKVLNNCDISDYLLLSFEILVNKNEWAMSRINSIIYLCSTHILKNIIDDTEKVVRSNNEESKFIKKTFLNAFSLLQNCICLETFCEVLECIQSVFCSKYKTKLFSEKVAKLECLLLKRNVDWLRDITKPLLQSKNNKEIFFIDNKKASLTHNSPFTAFFKAILDKNQLNLNEKSNDKNLFYVPEIFEIINKKLHISPLWSGFFLNRTLKDKSRLSNNPVEGWFKFFKNNILNINKRVRSNRLLFLSEITTPLYFYLNSKYKNYEDQVNIKFKGLKNDPKTDDKEMWSFKKPVKSEIGYHNMNFRVEKFEDETFQKTISEKPLVDLFADYSAPIYETLENLRKQETIMEIESEINIDFKLDLNDHKDKNDISQINNCLQESSVYINEKFDEALKLNKKDEIQILDNQKTDKINLNDLTNFDFIYFRIDEYLIKKSSMDRLLYNKWLSDNELMAFGKCILKNSKKKIMLFDSLHSTEIFNNGKTFSDLGFEDKMQDFEYLFGFICENFHWTCFFVDLKRNLFYYIDPKGEKEIRAYQSFEHWRIFASNYTIFKNRKWTLTNISHSLQQDSINCGVFVCFFLKHLVEGKELIFNTSKNSLIKKRLEIINVMKQNSSKNFCSKCSKTFVEYEKFIKCDCFHKFHVTCYDSTSEKINCPICF